MEEENEKLKEQLRKLKEEERNHDREKRERQFEEKKNYVRKYEIDPADIKKIRRIGGGGQGSVYEVRWLNGGGNIRVVSKYVKPFNPMTRISFFDLELYKVKEQLFHPSIVQIFGFVIPGIPKEDWSSVFPKGYGIVMEKMDGDICDLVRRKHLSIYRKCLVMQKMAIAINYLHTKNVVHRDIKCQNFLYSHSGRVIKVSDLGIARTPTGESVSGSGTPYSDTSVGGTWRWEAPEVHRSRLKTKRSIYSFKTDIWALGCAFFEVLLERKPYESFEQKHRWGRLKVIQAMVDQDIRPDLSHALNLPQSLKELLMQLWHPEPSQRISAGKILRYLEKMNRKYRDKYDDVYLEFKKQKNTED